MSRRLADALWAGTAAAVLSGVPSTLHALVTGRNVLEATVAAGSILLPGETNRVRLVLAAAPVHVAISLTWAVVLEAVLPRRRTTLWGALAGLGIAALDLGVAGRRFPRVRELPVLPQIADHVAYGAVVGAALEHRRRRPSA